jgi:hypothetical protein
LPKEWNGKRVAVRFATGRGFDARLVSDNAGGITVEPIKEDAEEESARSAFVPWAAVRYVQLLEEPSERQKARPKRTVAKKAEEPEPSDPADPNAP